MEQLSIWIDRFLIPIDDPGSRLYFINIFSTLFFIGFFYFKKNHSQNFIDNSLKSIFNKKYWWNRSAKIDYKIYFLNSILKIFLFIPFLDFTAVVARSISHWLLYFNEQNFAGVKSSLFNIFIFSIFAFVWDDFLRFIHHYLMHKVPALWRLHKLHHSARVLTPVTLYRTHPLESAMATLRNSISLGVSTGIFVFLFEARINYFNILGVNFFGFIFNFLASNLRHSHISLDFGIFENIFISPLQHQIHHSSLGAHRDKNLGVSLSVWDRFNNSLILSKELKVKLRFGL